MTTMFHSRANTGVNAPAAACLEQLGSRHSKWQGSQYPKATLDSRPAGSFVILPTA